MDDREIGEMSANIKNLCSTVKRLEDKLDTRLDKVESKQETLQKQQSETTASLSKHRGAIAACVFLIPVAATFLINLSGA